MVKTQAEEPAQWIKRFLCEHKDPSLDPQHWAKPGTGDRDRQILGTASWMKEQGQGSVRGPAPKTKVESDRGSQLILNSSLHTMHTDGDPRPQNSKTADAAYFWSPCLISAEPWAQLLVSQTPQKVKM